MNRERSDKMEEEKKEKKGFFARLVSGLTKTRDNIVSGIDSVFHGFSHIDDDFYEEIEETFREVAADFGHSLGCVDLATWLTMRVAKRDALL